MNGPGVELPAACDLLLAGGGHTHIGVLQRLAMAPVPGLRVTLVTPEPYLAYSGMLPATIAGHYEPADMQVDLRRLARYASADFVAAPAVGLDPNARRLKLAGRPTLGYDLLSLDIGSQPSPLAGADSATVIPVKPVAALMAGIERLEADHARDMRTAKLVIVGGGAGGVELALSLAYRFADWSCRPDLTLVSRGQALLPGHAPATAARLAAELNRAGIVCQTGRGVASVDSRDVVLDDDRRIAADAVFCATGANPPDWLAETGLTVDAGGFVRVHATLASTSHSTVFAAGDIAALPASRPKSGVFAVREAPILTANLVRAARGRDLREFRAQRAGLALISLGDRRAIASRRRWSLPASKALWWLKHYIDRRFMRRFNELPVMRESTHRLPARAVTTADTASAPAMRCAGCGAKLGRDVLAEALARIRADGYACVLDRCNGFDDAALLSGPPPGHEFVQSIDEISDLVGDAYRLGEIATEHALNDLYAAGAKPAGALLIARLPFAAPAVSAERLYQLLSGAATALDRAGARLTGGHSAESDRLVLGLAVTGTRQRGRVWPTPAAGDALILTRGLGTGLIFAADMRHDARGEWVETALAGMRASQRDAAAILDACGGVWRTDVTGFGLAVHLAQLMASAGYSGRLALDALPALPGAIGLAADGVRSSLHQANATAMGLLAASPDAKRHASRPLLFDPQTAGGLLAIVPADHAAACVAKLRGAGYQAATQIGVIDDRSAGRISVEASLSRLDDE